MKFLHTRTPLCLHRDLKSGNLLVSENLVVKVCARRRALRCCVALPFLYQRVSTPRVHLSLEQDFFCVATETLTERLIRHPHASTSVQVADFGTGALVDLSSRAGQAASTFTRRKSERRKTLHGRWRMVEHGSGFAAVSACRIFAFSACRVSRLSRFPTSSTSLAALSSRAPRGRWRGGR